MCDAEKIYYVSIPKKVQHASYGIMIGTLIVGIISLFDFFPKESYLFCLIPLNGISCFLISYINKNRWVVSQKDDGKFVARKVDPWP